MIQSENLIKLIKNDTQSNLNFYKNLLQEKSQDPKELVETASKIRKVLDFGQRRSKIQNQDMSTYSKYLKNDLKSTKIFTNIDNISLKKEGKSNPKIQIYNQRFVPKNGFISKKSQKYENIYNSYNSDHMIFHPISNDTSTEATNYDKDSDRKGEQKSKIIRNDIDYDNKIKPLFFMNRYVEYSYQDKGDNLYESGDLFRQLYEKKVKKEKNQEISIAKQDTIYLDIYKKLLKQMKEEKKENIPKPFTDSSTREEGKLASDELKNINRYKAYKNEHKSIQNMSGVGKEKNYKNDDFKTYILSKISTYENNTVSQVGMNNESLGFLNNERELLSLGKKVSEVTFNIEIEADILKKGKRRTKKDTKKRININGPLVNIFKAPSSNKELQTFEDRSCFDLRNIKLEENDNEFNNNNNEFNKKISENDDMNGQSMGIHMVNVPDNLYKQKFFIKKMKKKDKEIRKPIIFYSKKIPEFQNKSLASLFIELQNYYKELLFNIENASYKSLKFLSNPNCHSLELHPLESQKLLNDLYWHPKIQILSLPTSFVASLKLVMEARNWECVLTTLTCIQDTGVSSPTFEESLIDLFAGVNSIPIQNIHLIDVPYNKKIVKALFKHIEVFYSFTNDVLNQLFRSKPNTKRFFSNSSEKEFTSYEEVDSPKTTLLMNIQKTKLPIINLSWKKTSNPKLNKVNFEESIDLRAIYYILMDMLIKAYKFNNHQLPEVFNKLDLSETIVTDDIGFLVKIITQFKIIKELDISNTKLFNSGKVINNDNFLRKIKLTSDFMKVVNSEEENNFMEEIKKEIDFFKNCTEQERSLLPNNLKDEEISFTYFMGIFPLLQKLYVYNTDITENIARDIYVLFKKLKFFQGFYCSSPSNNNILSNTINTLAGIIQNDKSSFCENVFKITY